MGRVVFAVLILCLGFLGSTVEAARTHGNFAASTYYDTATEAEVKVDAADPSSTIPTRYENGYPDTAHPFNAKTGKYESNDTIPTRYEHGYPGTAHPFNAKTGQYESNDAIPTRYEHGYPGTAHPFNAKTGKYESDETVHTRYENGYPNTAHPFNAKTGKYESTDTATTASTNDTATNPGERYPRGYYPHSAYTQGSSSVTTPEKTTDVKDTSSKTTIYNRYETGYPASLTNQDKQQSSAQSAYPEGGRYPSGYYPKSEYAGDKSTQTTTGKTSTSVDPATERYPRGYYPKSEYAGNGKFSEVSESAARTYVSSEQKEQTSKTVDPIERGERYRYGYYPSSTYAGSQFKPTTTTGAKTVSYSSALGNFETLPYPSVGIPFDQSGGGCRTAYWVTNTAMWPKFFTVQSTVGEAFGSQAAEVYGDTTILQGLLNYQTDPFSMLGRTGCTAILNAYTRGRYKISHMKVIEEFNTGLLSKANATAQALVFETANVQSISAGNACS